MKTVRKIKIKSVDSLLGTLQTQLSEIDSVKEWADLSGWNDTKAFTRHIKKELGEKPIQIIIKTKLSLAFELLKFNPEMSCFEISRIIGKPDEKALNKFMKRHTGNPPSYFRNHKNASHIINENKKLKEPFT